MTHIVHFEPPYKNTHLQLKCYTNHKIVSLGAKHFKLDEKEEMDIGKYHSLDEWPSDDNYRHQVQGEGFLRGRGRSRGVGWDGEGGEVISLLTTQPFH